MKLKMLSAATIVILSFTTAVCAEEVQLGFIATLSGPRASMGEDALRGAQLAVEELQSSASGLQIRLLIEDSQGDPRQGVSAYKKLRTQQVSFVLTQNSNVSIPIARLAERQPVVQLAFNTTASAYSRKNDNSFRINGTVQQEAEVLASYLENSHFEAPGLVGVLVMEDEYPISLRTELRKLLVKAGINIAIDQSFLPGERDFRPIISKLRQKNVQYLILLSYQTEAGVFVRQQAELGLLPKLILGNTPLNSNEFFAAAGKHGDGVRISYQQVNHQHPAALRYREKFRQDVNWFSANGYDAVMIAARSVTECDNKFEQECIKRSLFLLQDYSGIGGTKSTDPSFGDMQDEYAIFVARGQRFSIEPAQ